MKKAIALLIFIVLLLSISLAAATGSSELKGSESPVSGLNSHDYLRKTGAYIGSVTLKYGDVAALSDTVDGIVVILATIKPNLTNYLTVMQNYYNVQHLIVEYDFDEYDTLKYSAQMEYYNTSLKKNVLGFVIQFKVSNVVMKMLRNETIYPNELEPFLDDLFIVPSLKY